MATLYLYGEGNVANSGKHLFKALTGEFGTIGQNTAFQSSNIHIFYLFQITGGQDTEN